MYINVGGAVHVLNSAVAKARAVEDSFCPENLIWIAYMEKSQEVLILFHLKNEEVAEKLEQSHNEIYNSPLAKAMRE